MLNTPIGRQQFSAFRGARTSGIPEGIAILVVHNVDIGIILGTVTQGNNVILGAVIKFNYFIIGTVTERSVVLGMMGKQHEVIMLYWEQ